jgi:hypothetical protein
MFQSFKGQNFINCIHKSLIWAYVKKKIQFNSKLQISLDGNVMMTYCKTQEDAFLELIEELKKWNFTMG